MDALENNRKTASGQTPGLQKSMSCEKTQSGTKELGSHSNHFSRLGWFHQSADDGSNEYECCSSSTAADADTSDKDSTTSEDGSEATQSESNAGDTQEPRPQCFWQSELQAEDVAAAGSGSSISNDQPRRRTVSGPGWRAVSGPKQQEQAAATIPPAEQQQEQAADTTPPAQWHAWTTRHQEQGGGDTLATLNCTCLWTAIHHLRGIPTTTWALAETAVAQDRLQCIRAQAKGMGMDLILTGPDPEQSKVGAGVGILVNKPAQVRQLAMSTQVGQSAMDMGRLLKGTVQSPKAGTYNLLVLYGWQDADRDAAKAARTNSLVTAAMLEEKDLHKTPTFLTGDLNAKLKNLPALQEAMDTGEWTDIGTLQHLHVDWQHELGISPPGAQQWPAPNCWAHGARQPSRRTYTLANRRALLAITGAAVGPWSLVDVHAPLLTVLKPIPAVPVRRLRQVATLQPEPAAEADTMNAEEHKQWRQQWKARVQSFMAEEFRAHAQTLDQQLLEGRTTDYWYLWCECVETAYIQARGLEGSQARAARGRGRVTFQTTTSHEEVTYVREQEEDHWTQVQAKHVSAPQRVIRMCRQLQNLNRANGHNQTWTAEMQALWNAIDRKHHSILTEQVRHQLSNRPTGTALHFHLDAEARRLNSAAIQHKRHITKGKQQALKEKLNHGPRKEVEAHRLVRKPLAPSLLFLEVSPGVVTAQPDLVDVAKRDKWGKIYHGNTPDHMAQVQNFLRHYGQYVYVQAEAAQVPTFTADIILDDCASAPDTSAGWDQWEAKDWRWLDRNAAQRLADLLNGIEDGLPWPEPMELGKAHLLSKEEEANLDPLQYRILLVMQRLYRRWATLRLRHLDKWVEQWRLPEMFAGVKEGGADIAWMSTALDAEQAALAKVASLLGLLDIFKCFDQLIPVLVQTVAGLAGMPPRVLWAYSRLMQNVTVVNNLSLGVGIGYSKPCSIPQGCPFSMAMLALVTRPWISYIKCHYQRVVPRALADDLSLWASQLVDGKTQQGTAGPGNHGNGREAQLSVMVEGQTQPAMDACRSQQQHETAAADAATGNPFYEKLKKRFPTTVAAHSQDSDEATGTTAQCHAAGPDSNENNDIVCSAEAAAGAEAVYAETESPPGAHDGWMQEWAGAVQDTLTYLLRLGAQPAPQKSILMGTTSHLRKWLRKRTWNPGAYQIPVKGSARDLGAFFNSTGCRLGGTTKKRMAQGSAEALRIGRLPRREQDKDRMLATKVMAKACYGVETTQPRVQDLRKLSASCADALVGKHQTQRSQEAVTTLAGHGRAEVHTNLLVRRWALLRRMWHLRAEWKSQILDIARRCLQHAGDPVRGKTRQQPGPVQLFYRSIQKAGAQ